MSDNKPLSTPNSASISQTKAPNEERRSLIKASSAVAAAGLASPFFWIKDASAQWNNTVEKGAKLRVLRWKRFVQGDMDAYLSNIEKFKEKTGKKKINSKDKLS